MTERSTRALPSDQRSRVDIATVLDETLFVQAGAGSGKTTALVGRVESLVRAGTPLSKVAAITFTEKAAAELRDRVRVELEARAIDESLDPSERDRCREAVDEVDAAAISTLHAFAQRILSEHPIEAGLPPAIEVLDEIASQLEFDDRWERFVDELLDDQTMERAILLAWTAGLKVPHLRDIARAFDQNWDLVATRVPLGADEIAPIRFGAFLDAVDEISRLRLHCDDPDDRLSLAIDGLVEVAGAVDAAADDIDGFRLVVGYAAPKSTARLGRKGTWPDPDCPIDDVRDRLAGVLEARESLTQVVAEAAIARLASAIARFTLAEADRRRVEGRLEFHDLLVLARQMVRDRDSGHDVRVALHDRYERLLLDEFQDTDPIQIELAVLLAAASEPTDHDTPWPELRPEPGRLFFVGDPKQSIYRFRRADIRLYLEAAGAFGRPIRSLTQNFRSTGPVLSWVNTVFEQLIGHEPGSQPEYEALSAARTDEPHGPAVVLLGTEPVDDATANELREHEAAGVVAAIETAVADRWEVTVDGAPRPARLGDICILLPARTSLPQLERALDDADIPFRAEASALLYGSREVRDLMAVLRSIDDPTDELALVTALRSPAFGCGDDDLHTFKVDHAGHWSHQHDIPETLPADHPVGQALRYLGGLYDARTWLTPSEIIERVLRERGGFELAFVQGRYRDIWRRYRFVVDQARAFGDSVGGSLRDYLRWVAIQSAEGARVAETVLPETDDDAVRILTVHASKGLQFPITIVSGMTTATQRRRPGLRVVFPHDSNGYGIRVRSDLTTEEFDRYVPLDEQMDFHEKLRLLYVACTRAVDHLVVSCHRRVRSKPPEDPSTMTSAELLWDASQRDETWQSPARVPRRHEGPARPAAPAVPDREAWAAARDAALAAASRPRVTSATAVAAAAPPSPAPIEQLAFGDVGASDARPGIAKEPRDLDLPPWIKGRYGTAVGRAVHGVLQMVDLAGDGGIDAIARAQAAAEGIDDQHEVVAALVASALRSPIVIEAATAEHWKELFVAAPVGDRLLEGYVDLLVRRPTGLVIVDYKTDHLRDASDIEQKVAQYGLQLASYAVAVEAATGEAVVDGVLVFCSPDGATEVIVDDLATSMSDAIAVIERGVGIGPTELE